MMKNRSLSTLQIADVYKIIDDAMNDPNFDITFETITAINMFLVSNEIYVFFFSFGMK